MDEAEKIMVVKWTICGWVGQRPMVDSGNPANDQPLRRATQAS
jgi:hypothetical protein